MFEGHNIIGIIPARGGSKGLHRKNLRSINGSPLVVWTIKQALASGSLSKVIVSTDDQEIAEVSMSCGASVPFLRPKHLAQDDSPTIDAVIHLLENIAESFDAVCLLEPTSPLRKPSDIDHAISILENNLSSCDAVVSVGEIHLENPHFCKEISSNGFLINSFSSGGYYQRQQVPRAYFPYGVFYGVKSEVIYLERTFYPKRTMPYLIDRWQNYEIDDELDLVLVETIMRRYTSI